MVLKLMKISDMQPLDLPRGEAQRRIQSWGIKEVPKIYFDGWRNLVANGNNALFYMNKIGYKFALVDYCKPVLKHHLDEAILVANQFQRNGIFSFDDLINYDLDKFDWGFID